MQKGGVLIKDEFKDYIKSRNPEKIFKPLQYKRAAFDVFLRNGKCTILTYKSRGGLIFKLTLPQSIKSPYKLSRSNAPEEDVTEILIKFVFISLDSIPDEEKKPFEIEHRTELNITELEEFKNEVRIQTDIFYNSLDEYLEPICPHIVFSDILDIINFQNLISFSLLRNSSEFTKELLIKILENNNLHNFTVGMIGMECLSGFVTLADYQVGKSPEIIQLTNRMGMYEISRLYKLGYIHGDLNKGNLLIHPDYKYFDGINGRVSLIDFGSTFNPTKLDPPKPLVIIDDNDNNLYEACNQSLLIDAPYYTKGTAFTHLGFQWLKIDPQYEDSVNQELKDLSLSRESMKSKFLDHTQSTINDVSVRDTIRGNVSVKDTIRGNVSVIEQNTRKRKGGAQLYKSSKSPDIKLHKGTSYKDNSSNLRNMKRRKSKSLKPKLKPQELLPTSNVNLPVAIIEKEKIANPFDELDPKQILTKIYIKKYIEEERENKKELIEYIENLGQITKDGKYKIKKKKDKKK